MASELIIFTHKITPRLTYVFRHIFVRVLNIPIKFTSKIEEFVAHDGLKMSYTKAPLGKEFFIKNHSLLFEQGVNDVDISVEQWDSVPAFFKAGKKSVIPYDIFAASFYLLSRYEEYFPFVLDKHDCFPAEESLAFKNNFLEKPIIDIWAHKLLTTLKNHFPDFEHTPKKYQYLSTFSVNQTFLFKSKGLIRNILGGILDVFTFKLVNFWTRLLVLLKIRKDPYNTFDKILKIKKDKKVATQFFFLISNYTTYDTNVSVTKSKYKLLLKTVADYAKVGLLGSYFTMENEELIKEETHKLSSIIHRPTVRSRQNLNRFKLPETYQDLMDHGITEDYSMGYYNQIGFRASTCTPFYYYDLDFEIQTPLKVFPYAFSTYTLKNNLELGPKKALMRVNQLANFVKQVNGTFISLFHNECLSNYDDWKYWEDFYEQVVDNVKE